MARSASCAGKPPTWRAALKARYTEYAPKAANISMSWTYWASSTPSQRGSSQSRQMPKEVAWNWRTTLHRQ
eukprot:2224160-Pyramimonas_sp.AAC.1